METVLDKIATQRREKSKSDAEKIDKEYFLKYIPFWGLTDMDDRRNWWLLVTIRILQALFMTKNMVHPDEYWQATQVAYNWVYGGVMLPWEWDD